MESYAPQKAADYQRLILFCYGFCDTRASSMQKPGCFAFPWAKVVVAGI